MREQGVPTWLRSLLLFVALALVTAALATEYVRQATASDCSDRARTEAIVCGDAPAPFELPFTLAVEVVVLAVVGREVLLARR